MMARFFVYEAQVVERVEVYEHIIEAETYEEALVEAKAGAAIAPDLVKQLDCSYGESGWGVDEEAAVNNLNNEGEPRARTS